jgi:hypothetical protein
MTPEEMKPLFIPLKTQWFRAFESGAKTIEYRPYGPRWNEKTLHAGRRATISHGYRGERLGRVITHWERRGADKVPPEALAIYPGRTEFVAIYLKA